MESDNKKKMRFNVSQWENISEKILIPIQQLQKMVK